MYEINIIIIIIGISAHACSPACKRCTYTPFCEGLFEGFWWSFTSLTSGYGAQPIRSIPAKLYGVVWILIGIVMFSFLTSSITTELMSAIQHDQPSMVGKNVGVLQYREYDAHLVVSQGGKIRETRAWNFYSDFFLLVRMLREGRIDGFLIDKYTLTHVESYLSWKSEHLDNVTYDEVGVEVSDMKFFREETIHSHMETTWDGYQDRMSYGVLVKHYEDYEFFNSAVRDNRLPLENTISSEMNELFPHHNMDTSLTLPPSQIYFNDSTFFSLYFKDYIFIMGALIAMIMVCGVVYEVYFYRRRVHCSCEEGRPVKSGDL